MYIFAFDIFASQKILPQKKRFMCRFSSLRKLLLALCIVHNASKQLSKVVYC